MATFTIKTRNHGEKEFSVRDGGGYVRLSSNGSEPVQICVGGSFRGNTIIADGDTLSAVARKWWKQWLKAERDA